MKEMEKSVVKVLTLHVPFVANLMQCRSILGLVVKVLMNINTNSFDIKDFFSVIGTKTIFNLMPTVTLQTSF